MKKYKHIYSIATAMVNPFLEEDRMIVDFICHCKGFTAIHNTPDCMYSLWMFDTKENAEKARRLAESQGIHCGKNIGRFKWDGKAECIADMDETYMNNE